ncbi:MAG: outer membrane beta-barrel protein [Cyclobacteriaceae bacterium]|nr:outer membrane beta-barrel protein [Cyclobacteriaceae bacterium]
MKKSLLFVLVMIAGQSLFAQVELTPFGGWLWTGSVALPTYSGYYNSQNAKISDMGNYGVRLGVRLPSYVIAEFEWNHTEVDFEYRDFDGERQSIPVTANYYWLGGIRELKEGPMIPYGIFNIGAANFKNTESGNNVNTYFAVGFGGGIKYFMNDKVRDQTPGTYHGSNDLFGRISRMWYWHWWRWMRNRCQFI